MPKPPFRPVADVKVIMRSMVDPAADIGWNAVGTIMTAEGTKEIAPKNETEWVPVVNGAVVLMESGNLLMMEPRAKDNKDWIKMSQALVDAGAQVYRAAQAKNAHEVFNSGEMVAKACDNCHQKYWDTPAQ